MSVLKWQVNSASNFALFFLAMKHNSSANLKVIPFLLWTKGSHQSPNFDTFKCSGENLPNCLFQTTSQFFFKMCITLQCHELNCFVAQPIYTLVTRSQLKLKFFRLSNARSKFVKFLTSILKRQVSSSSIFVSFFIVMTHKSSVNFKVIHFLLWPKGSHQSSNFDTFECSSENLPDSSCHFPSNKSVFLKILHHSSMSWKITPL